jgi:paraquat-inducible protein A
MVDVFLLGTFVAYTRLRAIASVEIGPALIALGGVMLMLVAVDATIDRQAIWDSFDRRGLHARVPARTHGKLIGCHVCARVSQAADGAACPRCRHPLHHRKPNSVARAWAFLVAAALLYIPANALPVMTVMRLGRGGSHTILGGVVELFEDHLWPLALIVLLASLVVPVAKLGALAVMLVTTHRRTATYLVHRTRLFRVIAVIGRWSMIDIFCLTTLVALVKLGFLATILPGDAAVAFAGVVILTMLATEAFDPRLMWDAARPVGLSSRAILSAVHSSEATP